MVKRSSRRRTHKRNRRMRGGFIRMNPADLADTSMNSSGQESLRQGTDYARMHMSQHGGDAPVGDTGVLDNNLRSSAHLGPLDESFHAIAGMSDQGGGRRKTKRRGGKKTMHRGGKKTMRRGSKRTKHRGSKRTKRRHQGGSHHSHYAPYSQTGTDLLLPSPDPNLNNEWKLAENPNSFVPDAVLKAQMQ